MDELQKIIKKVRKDETYCTSTRGITFRDVLANAIKAKALYSDGKIKFIESSLLTN